MASAKEFQEPADDCLVWAKTVTSDRERARKISDCRSTADLAASADHIETAADQENRKREERNEK